MELWKQEEISRFGREVADIIADYYASLEERPITPPAGAEWEGMFGGPLPEEGTDPFSLLAEVKGTVLPHSFHIPTPRYFGLFNPTPTVIAVFADAIASMINQNMAAWCHGPAGSQIEKTVIRWLADLAGLPAGAFGTLTSGGSLANYTGIKLALNERFPDVRRRGLRAVEGRPAFYVSDQAHYSLDKIADMAGLGQEAMRLVPGDDEARIRVDALAERIESDRSDGWVPFCVVGIAGTTTSGAVDPLAELGDYCAREKIWYHVDAAWGAAALLSPAHRGRLAGIEKADSVAVDPHKWFSVPFTAGGILVRDGAALRRGFEVKPHYVSDKGFTDHEDLNLYQYGVAGSRRLDALKVWLSLRQYGRRGYAETIERQIEMAEYLASRIEEEDHLELVTKPSLGVCCFRIRPRDFSGDADRLQMKVQQRIEGRGRVWISTSVLRGTRVVRFCVTSHLTRQRHVDLLLREIRHAIDAVL